MSGAGADPGSCSLRAYDAQRDQEALHRIWHETGWLGKDDEEAKAMDLFLACSRAHVAELNGEAECMSMTMPGTVRHGVEDLPMGMVAAVTTSHVARRQGFATRLTARAIAADVADGALVSSLGMFEQGFYDKLGFGSGGYVHRFGFDPAELLVDGAKRPPRRLGIEDFEAVHRNRLERRLAHGSCNILPPGLTHAELQWGKDKSFGLGYFDGPGGTLSHHLWISCRGDMEVGPGNVRWMAWRTREQFHELMGLIRNLGDQFRLMWMRETHEMQIQDLVRRPLHRELVSKESKFDARMRVIAYWQMRMNDVPACLARTHLEGEPVRCNVVVSDPIESIYAADAPWRGAGGEYVVTFGPESAAEPGRDGALPTLRTSINAFTRMWLGIRPATALSFTDDLEGPDDLLAALDRRVRLPEAQPDWDF
ncbi:MAG: GNAT family N-acetyltransferase [Planctomycetes bacterium]|nr:GNAT family N-acetyltransferase [Planctomycetota bacterium]